MFTYLNVGESLMQMRGKPESEKIEILKMNGFF